MKDKIIKKRYPFYDPMIAQKGIKVGAYEVKDLMDDLIDEIIKMYVPDGNPELWLNKIKALKRDSLIV